LRIDTRFASGNVESLRKYAAEMAALAPDVILVGGAAPMPHLLQATRTVPIVFTTVTDPVGAGYVDSMAKPGGNATGDFPRSNTVGRSGRNCSGDRACLDARRGAAIPP
jgi:putative ABC transport system substrate-binding protein